MLKKKKNQKKNEKTTKMCTIINLIISDILFSEPWSSSN